MAADASQTGIGGVLLQRYPDGQTKAVFHMAKTLDKAQQNYSQIEKEALALVTVVERFKKFIYGRHFTLQTDHRPLLALFRTSKTKGLKTRTANRLKRWPFRLLGYDFTIEYSKTTDFGQADALSRLIQQARQDASNSDLEEVIASLQGVETELRQIVYESTQLLPRTAHRQLQQATVTDGVLAEVRDRLQTHWLLSDSADSDLIPYYRRREYLALVDDILVLDDRVIIPPTLRPMVLQLHTAHPGMRRMVQLARGYFYWPNMHKDIEKFVKSCIHCANTAAKPVKEPLRPWPPTKKVWSRIHMDFAGSIQGKWILITVDSHSKFLDAAWFSTVTASATCTYLRRLFCCYGPPDTIVSDNGTQFTAEEFAQLCADFNIVHLFSTPGHPQSNGQAEMMVRTLKNALELHSLSQRETELDKVLYTYNYTPSDAVPDRKSPAELFFGRRFRTPLDIFLPARQVQALTS